MKGKISQWNDEKGFGFIVPDDGAEKVFFHISSIKTSTRRPQIGDSVVYESTLDSQNRLKAKAVVIEGEAAQLGISRKSPLIHVEPPRKNIFDYFLIAVLLVFLGMGGLVFYQTNHIESIVPYAVLAIVAGVVLTRQKKPKAKQFSCSRCKTVVDFDTRTIRAWNNGSLKFYCSSCHQHWILDNPIQNSGYTVSRGGGCLGILCLFLILPIVAGISICQWIA
jgi:cold shock CspA family protein